MQIATTERAIWRSVFEMSNIMNNNEFVCYTDHKLLSFSVCADEGIICVDIPTVSKEQAYSAYRNYVADNSPLPRRVLFDQFSFPRLKVSRKVTQAEIDQGLDTTYVGPNIVPVPDTTRIIDELTAMFEDLSGRVERGIPMTNALTYFLAYSHYDCMSSGTSVYCLAMARYLIEKYDIDRSIEIYVGPESTVEKFLEEIKDIPRYDFAKMLPAEVIL